jgi:hypothetical protein
MAGLLQVIASITLSRPLHPSGGHFQSSTIGIRWRACHLSLEGLCPRWQAVQMTLLASEFLSSLATSRSFRRIHIDEIRVYQMPR